MQPDSYFEKKNGGRIGVLPRSGQFFAIKSAAIWSKNARLVLLQTCGRDAERCLALAAALQNAPDFVLLEQVFAPEADIFCFVFLPVQKSFRFKCDLVYGQDISSGEHWTAAETAALEAAVNRIAEKMFQTAG